MGMGIYQGLLQRETKIEKCEAEGEIRDTNDDEVVTSREI